MHGVDTGQGSGLATEDPPAERIASGPWREAEPAITVQAMQTVKQSYDGVESSSWEFLGYDWFLGNIKGKNAKKHDFPMFGNHEKS